MNPFATSYGGGKVIVPSDTSTGAADQSFSALFVGGAGTVTVVLENKTAPGADITLLFTGVVAGQLLPIAGRRVNVTGTSATNIVGLQ